MSATSDAHVVNPSVRTRAAMMQGVTVLWHKYVAQVFLGGTLFIVAGRRIGTGTYLR